MTKPKSFTVFEHKPLRIGDCNALGVPFTSDDLKILTEYYGSFEDGVPYFALGNQCVWFCEFVGVLQVSYLTIEVLPKIDDSAVSNWRNKLIDILHKVHQFEVSVTGTTNLSLKANSILQYYINIFLEETRYLLQRGLIKKYRSLEANTSSLKGKLLVGKHVVHNCVHKERFYVKHTTYDSQNLLNKILFKTLKLIQAISQNSIINSSASSLLLDFPQMTDIKVSEETFNRIVFDRKNESYKTAISVSKLLLLHYHPDLKSGKNNVLALMFDMNLLWEKFVFVTLKKKLKGYVIKEQVAKLYWKFENSRAVALKPDVEVSKNGKHYILDTKWKLIDTKKPSYQDLQQMFAYTKYFRSSHTILLYPGIKNELRKGFFLHEEDKDQKYPCSVGTIALKGNDTIENWQESIAVYVEDYLHGKAPILHS